MKIIRPGLEKDEIFCECDKCHCQFIFNINEMIGIQIQGGYIKCPHCDKLLFINKNFSVKIKQ